MEVNDYPTCQRTYATLRIYPGQLDPTEVTSRLGIEPSSFQRRGETTSAGARQARLHGWFLTSEGAVESEDIRRHLDWLLEQIVSRDEAVYSLQADGCVMDVSCFWISRSGHGGPSVLPAQMRELGRLNLELWFDVYLGDGGDVERPTARP